MVFFATFFHIVAWFHSLLEVYFFVAGHGRCIAFIGDYWWPLGGIPMWGIGAERDDAGFEPLLLGLCQRSQQSIIDDPLLGQIHPHASLKILSGNLAY